MNQKQNKTKQSKNNSVMFCIFLFPAQDVLEWSVIPKSSALLWAIYKPITSSEAELRLIG